MKSWWGEFVKKLGIMLGFEVPEEVDTSVYALACAIDVMAQWEQLPAADKTEPTLQNLMQTTDSCSVTAAEAGVTAATIFDQAGRAITGFATWASRGITGFFLGTPTGGSIYAARFVPVGAKEAKAVRCYEDHCEVEEFELPHDVRTFKEGFAGDVLEFGKAFIGAVGDPRYILSYEVFPKEAEGDWIYEPMDYIWTAAAIGAFLMLLPGGIKVGYAATKGGVLYMTKRGFLKTVGKETRDMFIQSLKSEIRLAFAKSFAPRMLTEKDVMRYLLAKQAATVMGKENFELAAGNVVRKAFLESSEKPIWKSFFGPKFIKWDAKIAGYKGPHMEVMDDLLAVAKTTPVEEITPELVEKNVLNALRRRGLTATEIETHLDKVLAETGETSMDKVYMSLSYELKKARWDIIDRTFLKETHRQSIRTKIKTEILDQDDRFYNLLVKNVGVMKKETGRLARLKKLVGKKVLTADQEKMFLDEADDIARMTETIWENDVIQILDDPALATTKGNVLDKFKAAWDKGLADADTTVAQEIKDRATAYVKGVLGLDPASKVGKSRMILYGLAFTAAVASIIGSSQLDKYIPHDNSLVLFYPRIFGGKNVKAYKLHDAVKNYWVAIRAPALGGEYTLRANLIAPCKANVEVRVEKCDCAMYVPHDKIGVIYRSATCSGPGICGQCGGLLVGLDPDDPTKLSHRSDITREHLVICDKEVNLEEEVKKQIEWAKKGAGTDTLVAVPGDNKVRLQWTESGVYACTPKYRLYRRAEDEADFVLIEEGAQTDFLNTPGIPRSPVYMDQTVVNGKKYFYKLEVEWPAIAFCPGITEVYNEVEVTPGPTPGCYTYGQKERPFACGLGPSDPFEFHRIINAVGDGVALSHCGVPRGIFGEKRTVDCLVVRATDMAEYKAEDKGGVDPNYCRMNSGNFDNIAQFAIDAVLIIVVVGTALFPPAYAVAAPAVLATAGAAGTAAQSWIDVTARWPTDQS